VLSVTWMEDGKAFEYQRDGKRYRYDVAARRATELGPAHTNVPPGVGDPHRGEGRKDVRGSRPARGRQQDSTISPDGKLKAFYRSRNLWLSDTNGTNEIAVTQDGDEKARIKYGTASWVYGEELRQTTAIWWSTNSDRVAFYRFDESHVPDFYLLRGLTNVQDQ